MSKRSSKTSPTAPAKVCEALDIDNLSTEVKELSFEDTKVQFKNPDGKWRVSLRQLAEYYEIPFFKASQKLTVNSELFQDLKVDTVRVSSPEMNGIYIFKDGKLSDVNLSIRDAFSFLTTLNYKKYEDERRQKLIRMRNWLTDNAEKILTGEVVLSPRSDDIEKLDGTYGEHSFLTGVVTHIVRKIRKKDPHCGCPSEQEIYQEDFNDMRGPGRIEPQWRNRLDTEDGKSLTLKKVFQSSELLVGNTNKESLRNAVIRNFEEYYPLLKPPFMPTSRTLDTTRQMKLIGECES